MMKVPEVGAEGLVMMPQMLEDREPGYTRTRGPRGHITTARLAAGTRRRVDAYGLMQGTQENRYGHDALCERASSVLSAI
jgi:hypothetical protein